MENMAQMQRTHHDAFLSNPAVRSIADRPKWTISDKDKRPISLYCLLNRHGEVKGCHTDMPGDMLPLDEMIDRFHATFPNAGLLSNFAYNLDVMEDDLVVLDIEPTCPPAQLRRFMQLPYLYGERSLSGKGIHLVFPKPSNFDLFPKAMKKVALKGPGKHYEILLNHWVTFTGNVLPQPVGKNTDNQKPFEALYAELAMKQTESDENELNVEASQLTQNIADIPDSDYILELLLKDANVYNRQPSDFDNDMSRYEHGFVGWKYYKLRIIMELSRIKRNGHLYTVEERILLIYEATRQQLPYREKHEQINQHMPWLLYQATTIVARDTPKNDPAAIEYKKRTGRDLRDE